MDQQDLSGVMARDDETILDDGTRKNPEKSGKKGKKRRRERRESDTVSRKEQRTSSATIPKYDHISRRNLITAIQNRANTFPDKLGPVVANKDLEGMEYDDLEKLLEETRHILATTGGGQISDLLPLGLLLLYEMTLTNLTDIRAEGIHKLAEEPAFNQAAKEMMLDMDLMFYVPPHIRLIAMLGHTTYLLHEAQKGTPRAISSNAPPGAMHNENINQSNDPSDDETAFMRQMAVEAAKGRADQPNISSAH